MTTAQIALHVAAGGGGGQGLMSQASTLGGFFYLVAFTCTTLHVLVTRVRKGRDEAKRELQKMEDEYKLRK